MTPISAPDATKVFGQLRLSYHLDTVIFPVKYQGEKTPEWDVVIKCACDDGSNMNVLRLSKHGAELLGERLVNAAREADVMAKEYAKC